MQQEKEHDKCPPNQTKEEEIGNLPEKEFRIMIVKMIQNLENKMELHINRLETRIEKMQEMFNKDIEEIIKSQYIMNNGISLVQFSHSVMCNSLRPHESQHARPPCPSPTPGVYSNSCPLRW